jgi:alkylation response protein AidB-like acyl-CoA dehydrogenase
MFDLDPTPLQQDLLSTMRTFLQRECPTDRVRAVEDLGFDPTLWSQLHSMGIVDMSLPADHGVFGAGLLDAAVVCEFLGEFLTPALVV